MTAPFPAAPPRPSHIRVTEVGPRDGLQNEPAVLGVEDKVAFVDLLSRSGVAEIEVSSFVSARWVPQLADAEEVFRSIIRRPAVAYSALVPNQRGMERALAAGIDRAAFFAAATESFSRRNTNASIDTVLGRLEPVVKMAASAGIPVRGYVSCAVACPYEGPVEPAAVRGIAQRMLSAGVQEVALADTIGVAGPGDIERLYEGLQGLLAPQDTSLHLHDTRGTALACALRAIQLGVRRFDASCGGIGGCPYAPGAAGNLATEDLVYMCGRMGLETGVDLEALFAAARHAQQCLGRRLPGRVFTADGGPCSPDPA